MVSCLKDGEETLVLPKVVYATPIDEVIPTTIQSKIETYMPIYKGSNPPNIEGTFLVSTMVLVYTSDGEYSVGDAFSDETLTFSNQNGATNLLTYSMKQASSVGSSSDVSVSGSGNNFSAYFVTTGTTDNISFKTATVITGNITTSGIENYQEAFVLLEKGSDPDNKLMAVDTYRVFKDNDGLASKTSLTKSKKLETNGISIFKTSSMNN